MGFIELLIVAIGVTYASVPPPDKSFDGFRNFMRPPLKRSGLGEPPTVTSHRDQTEVLLSATSTDVRDFSGDVAGASNKLPELLEKVLEWLSVETIQSYAFQLSLEYRGDDTEDMTKWLGPRILNDNFEKTAWRRCVPSVVDVSFRQGAKVHTLELKVIDASTVMILSSISQGTEALPGRDSLGHELAAQYDNVMDTLKRVGFG